MPKRIEWLILIMMMQIVMTENQITCVVGGNQLERSMHKLRRRPRSSHTDLLGLFTKLLKHSDLTGMVVKIEILLRSKRKI